MLQFHLQERGVQIESHLLGMIPYLATIVVLVLISRGPPGFATTCPPRWGEVFRPGT